MAWTNRGSLMELISDYWNNKQRANLLCSDAFSLVQWEGLNLVRPVPGDRCPTCDEGHLLQQKTIEVRHTFYLVDRYSVTLGAEIKSIK